LLTYNKSTKNTNFRQHWK